MIWIESVWSRFWSLLETLGWWVLLGMLLVWLLQFLPAGNRQKGKKSWHIPAAALLGALLPMCNFAAIPLAAALLTGGAGTGVSLAFLAGATLLNPGGLLLSWGYLGAPLTLAYALSAAGISLLAGFAGGHCEHEIPRPEGFPDFASKLLLWLMLGIIAEAVLLAAAPPSLWQGLVLNPPAASLWETAAAGLLRHVCIPDDISLAASLTASGLRPGWAVLLLLMGVSTNLPELFVLYGVAGKKTAAVYLFTTVSASILAALLTQWVLGPGFVPQFNLANAEGFTALANLLSIRTWMPAKIPCACALLLLSGWALWRRGKQWFGF